MKYLLLLFCFVPLLAFAQESSGLNSDIPVFSEEIDKSFNAEGEEKATLPESVYVNKVVLQGLNKVTTKTYPIEANIGDTIQFGSLQIEIRTCWKAPPEENPENAILMNIKEKDNRVFLGWMFSSSPAISALEHPVYDITVIECLDDTEKSEQEEIIQ